MNPLKERRAGVAGGVSITPVAGRWSLVAGRWSLVAGRWSLVAGRQEGIKETELSKTSRTVRWATNCLAVISAIALVTIGAHRVEACSRIL